MLYITLDVICHLDFTLQEGCNSPLDVNLFKVVFRSSDHCNGCESTKYQISLVLSLEVLEVPLTVKKNPIWILAMLSQGSLNIRPLGGCASK